MPAENSSYWDSAPASLRLIQGARIVQEGAITKERPDDLQVLKMDKSKRRGGEEGETDGENQIPVVVENLWIESCVNYGESKEELLKNLKLFKTAKRNHRTAMTTIVAKWQMVDDEFVSAGEDALAGATEYINCKKEFSESYNIAWANFVKEA